MVLATMLGILDRLAGLSVFQPLHDGTDFLGLHDLEQCLHWIVPLAGLAVLNQERSGVGGFFFHHGMDYGGRAWFWQPC